MKGYFVNLLSDPGFMGALLGALITGIIGITIMLIQTIKQDKRDKLKESKYLYKTLFEFVNSTKRDINNLENYVKELENINSLEEYRVYLAKISRVIHIAEKEYLKINESAITAEVYPTFLNIGYMLDILRMDGEDIYDELERKNTVNFDKNIKSLKVISSHLNRDINKLNDILKETENKLKII